MTFIKPSKQLSNWKIKSHNMMYSIILIKKTNKNSKHKLIFLMMKYRGYNIFCMNQIEKFNI